MDFVKGKERVGHLKEFALDSANHEKTAQSVLKKPALDPAMLNNQNWIQPFPWHCMSTPYASPNKFSLLFICTLFKCSVGYFTNEI
jgi:hypothetical protein